MHRPVPLRQLAARAALAGGTLLRRRFGDAGRIEHKGAIDLVTEADREAEARVVATIREAAPEHAILTEEKGTLGTAGATVRWLIDPLDGTTNFAHDFAMFAVSVAAELRGEVVAGAVHIPMLGELFSAERGAGAQLLRVAPGAEDAGDAGSDGAASVLAQEVAAGRYGSAIAVSRTAALDGAFLATGFPYDIRETPNDNLDHFARFSKRCLAIRRAGAAALDLAYMACGRFDGFWELRLKPWDWAAGSLLIEEAGGRVTGIDGGRFHLEGPAVCASNGLIHDAMLEVLAESEHVRGDAAARSSGR
ncbi:MAG: inositol monophosphatase family protein [Candidatus Eiseniibacteriota bacterium]|jgi:myo-inositol-1(or 4)-monophosphatase